MEIKDLKDIEFLKEISMKEFKESVNKYLNNNLEIGNKYCTSYFKQVNNIHKIIQENFVKGVNELYNKYILNTQDMNNIFRLSTYELSLRIEYKEISVWENVGKYTFDKKIRKNASVTNDLFVLTSNPVFIFYDVEIENLSMYDYIIKLLQDKKKAIIGNYKSEIASYKKNIRDNEKRIKNLESVL